MFNFKYFTYQFTFECFKLKIVRSENDLVESKKFSLVQPLNIVVI